MTTPVSDPAYDDPWNVLPTGPDPWPFLALANGIAEYLVGAGDAQLNYQAGQTAILHLAPNEQVSSYVLEMPGASPVAPIAHARPAGPRRFRRPKRSATTEFVPAAQGGRLDRGFSVNARPRSAISPASISPRSSTRSARTASSSPARAKRSKSASDRAASAVNCFPHLILAVAVVLGHRTTPRQSLLPRHRMNELRLHPVMDPLAICHRGAWCSLRSCSLRPAVRRSSRAFRWATLVGVAARCRAPDAHRHAAAGVGLHEAHAATGVARAAGRRLAEHAGGRFARRRVAVGRREIAARRLAANDLAKLTKTWDISAYRFDTGTAPLKIDDGTDRAAARAGRRTDRARRRDRRRARPPRQRPRARCAAT